MRWFSAFAPALGVVLSLTSQGIAANPVPADDRSLLSGSDLYVLHCAECHGWAPMQRYSERFNETVIEDEYDFTDLVSEQFGAIEEEEDNTVYLEDEDEWPEWAQFPDPGDRASDPDERLLIMEEMTRAIDDYYGTGDEEEVPIAVIEEETDLLEPDSAADYTIDDRAPGASDLLRPELFLYGYDEFTLFDSIADGTSVLMPGFRDELESDEQVWDLVNFLHSLWPQQDAFGY